MLRNQDLAKPVKQNERATKRKDCCYLDIQRVGYSKSEVKRLLRLTTHHHFQGENVSIERVLQSPKDQAGVPASSSPAT